MSGFLFSRRLVKPISFFKSRVLVPNRKCTSKDGENGDDKTPVPPPPEKWIHFYLEDRENNTFTINGMVGVRLRHAICRALITPGFGLCGGMPSCTTCHVYFDPHFYDQITPPDSLEAGLLKLTAAVTPWSRLSCQTFIEEEMLGMTLQIPPVLKDIRLIW